MIEAIKQLRCAHLLDARKFPRALALIEMFDGHGSTLLPHGRLKKDCPVIHILTQNGQPYVTSMIKYTYISQLKPRRFLFYKRIRQNIGR